MMIEQLAYHRVRLVECPLCGEDLRNQVPSVHFEQEHDPSDVRAEATHRGDT